MSIKSGVDADGGDDGAVDDNNVTDDLIVDKVGKGECEFSVYCW